MIHEIGQGGGNGKWQRNGWFRCGMRDSFGCRIIQQKNFGTIEMVKAVFYHKSNSQYDDEPSLFYNFPKIYLSRVEQTVRDLIVYYGPLPKKQGRYYSAIARVAGIRPDPNKEDHYYADMEEFLDFDRAVEYRENGVFEENMFLPNGGVNGGRSVQAVRLIVRIEFTIIVEAGLSETVDWPDRDEVEQDFSDVLGFGEAPQPALERPIIERITSKKFRNEKFKLHIRRVYDRTCAFTGLRLINGKGRPEVEAAHIMPVEKNGPDSIRNGIALSGTVHWMFDRGLLSVSDDFDILKSRHLNHDVSALLNKDMKAKVPSDYRLQPHPHYLSWHRENVFKQ